MIEQTIKDGHGGSGEETAAGRKFTKRPMPY
jgi:hypothetical protein